MNRLGVLVLLTLPACGPGGSADRSPAASWALEDSPLVTIGAVDGPEAYTFHRVSDAALLPDGQLVVADAGLGVLRVFDQDGRFQVEMGGRGDGPGEFRGIGDIAILPPDTILAFDPDAQRLTTWLADGTLIETVAIRAEEGFPELFLGLFENDDPAFAWIHQRNRPAD